MLEVIKKAVFYFILILIIVVGVLFMSNRSLNEIDISKINTFSFHYNVGNYLNGDVLYKLDYNDNTYYVTIKPAGIAIENAKIMEVEEEFELRLEDIIREYDVVKWDGFSKRDKTVLDGYSFELSIKMDSGNVDASGYMKWPKYYQGLKADVNSLFEDLLIKEFNE